MNLSDDFIAELELLALYNLDTSQEGIKVHNNATARNLKAVTRLHQKGLISQIDGGYLTALGRDAAEHLQALLIIHAEPVHAP